MKKIQKGLISLAVVVLESAFVPIGLNVGGLAIGVVPLLFYTSLVSTVTLAIISYLEDKGRGFFAIFKSKKMLVLMIIAGLMGYAVTQLLQNVGTIGTNPSVSAVVWRSWVVMIAVLTPLTLRQKVTRKQYASVLLGFVSVYLIASNGLLLGINAQQLPFIAMLLCSGLVLSVSTLMLKKYNPSTIGFVLLASIASFVFSIPLMIIYNYGISLSMSLNAVLSILFLGVIDSGFGALLYYHSFKTFSTSFVGSTLLSIPFLTILLSSLLIGTPIRWYYIASAVILSAAIFVQRDDATKAPERITSKSFANEMQIFDITSAFVGNKSPMIYEAVQGSSMALAMRLKGQSFDADAHGGIFDKHGCVAFTTASPHEEVKHDEIEFIRDILGLDASEDALICIGNPNDAEKAFGEFVTSNTGSALPKTE